ncbi:hypothetical protein LTR91_013861 [Friedmanniomyces endolithicus]|uniref:Uncharacterized protein n=1 Tax=Friedmanniomyces endolithicus TaxID=329885 RepID=A0AAN6QNS6_9PEZI|nr:hypothetical protein LTS00_014353 [Friedmanniomyces endolithicus]KAK0283464.1 hypothetical protein LTR35_006539 [Friedmanniomyces endolithicus]KAK0310758.1 hypothetical protein LTR01_003913 [Friedmanniomyces endolithicus]KAK0328078.1 hypothetical protein LTR82_000005 [Friedmanniomyces endolithicus]KAK0823696.1 hypothetical protein LTR73_008276 [Friedmanniomyces endolithicus]
MENHFRSFVGYDAYAASAWVSEQPMNQSDDEFAGLMELLDGQPGLFCGMGDGRQDALESTTSGDAAAPRLPVANFRTIPASPSSSPDPFHHSFEPTHDLDLGLCESTMSTISAVPASDFSASNGFQDPMKLTTGGDTGVQWPQEVDLSATQRAPLRSCGGLSSQVAPSARLGKAPQSRFAPQDSFGDAVEWAPQGQRAAVSAATNALMLPQGHYLPFNSFAHANEQAVSGQSLAAISAAPHPVMRPYGQFPLPPFYGDTTMQAPYGLVPGPISVTPSAAVLGQRNPSPRKNGDKQTSERNGKKASRKASAKEEDPAADLSGEQEKRKSNNPAGARTGLKYASPPCIANDDKINTSALITPQVSGIHVDILKEPTM